MARVVFKLIYEHGNFAELLDCHNQPVLRSSDLEQTNISVQAQVRSQH